MGAKGEIIGFFNGGFFCSTGRKNAMLDAMEHGRSGHGLEGPGPRHYMGRKSGVEIWGEQNLSRIKLKLYGKGSV